MSIIFILCPSIDTRSFHFFSAGFTKGGTARCFGQYSSNIPISFTYGSTKTKVTIYADTVIYYLCRLPISWQIVIPRRGFALMDPVASLNQNLLLQPAVLLLKLVII